ncbi:MAG: nitrite/sulfite reductase, partial [Candidatus Omnitrophica bacterium]|nr:nitrite/sulfite reductase [Candidatus Omnitrophota bacterium]
MSKKPFEPNFNTPEDQFCKEELNKLNQHGLLKSSLYDDFRDFSTADMVWESEQIAKSTGIYLEFDRSLKGAEKHWYFMIRMANPGGGAISREQWRIIDELSQRHCKNPYGLPTLRLTNRQTIQFHWIKKEGVVDIVKSLAESGFNTLNGCGDNTRNVMACPLSRFSPVFNAYEWAQKTGLYFQLPLEPFIKIFAINPEHVRHPDQSFSYGKNLLNRKFKIAFTCLHHDGGKLVPDNCVEMRTHDMG